jgi:hypothetical protein
VDIARSPLAITPGIRGRVARRGGRRARCWSSVRHARGLPLPYFKSRRGRAERGEVGCDLRATHPSPGSSIPLAANGSGPSPGPVRGFLRTRPRGSWAAWNWIRVVRDGVARRCRRATPVRPGQRLGMLTLQIADQSLTDLAAKAETRWAIYLRDPIWSPNPECGHPRASCIAARWSGRRDHRLARLASRPVTGWPGVS